MSKPAEAVIIGGGACGLFAAAELGRRLSGAHSKPRVVILEKLPRAGKKLLVTGNGRCNLTNIYAGASGYYGDSGFARRVLEQYPVQTTLKRFEQMGLLWKEEAEGRVYPDCEQAASVLEVLRLECARLGVEIRTDAPVSSIEKDARGFLIKIPEGSLRAGLVLLCCGGQAAPTLGSDGGGYALACALGHTVLPVFPALVQLKSASKVPKKLKGLRKKCHLHLCVGGKDLPGVRGEVLFTEYGLSGIAVMELSRIVGEAEAFQKESSIEAVLDLFPDTDAARLYEWLCNRRKAVGGLHAPELLTGLTHTKLRAVLVQAAGIPADKPAGSLKREELRRLAALLKRWTLAVTGTTGFSNAQVTAGGVDTGELCASTMESKRCEGLYLGGEIVNVDGACGGYNLQWAWSTAQAAANAMAERINEKAER